MTMIKQDQSNYKLWKQNNATYIHIQKNPYLRKAMKDDPGVKFMQKGWTIVIVIVLALAVISRWC